MFEEYLLHQEAKKDAHLGSRILPSASHLHRRSQKKARCTRPPITIGDLLLCRIGSF